MSDERKKALLDRAVADKELLAHVPAIVAFAFGVLPLRKDGTVLTVASMTHASREALRVLRDVLEAEIVATPFDERLLQPAIARAYPDDDDQAINFPTFEDENFLGRPDVGRALRTAKVEKLGRAGSELQAGSVVLASITYKGRLTNVEHGRPRPSLLDTRRIKYELRDEDLVWTWEGDHPVLWPDVAKAEPLASVLLDEFRFSDHSNYSPGSLYAEHSARGVAISPLAFPFVIHPTEIQLLRVERSGALVFHAYDHEETALPGRPLRFACRYHFLSFGQRLRREIEISVHEVFVADRGKLALGAGKPRWGCREIGRWFCIP